jgi:hypothetical protein
MKLMASGVIISAAIIRSPSFLAIFIVDDDDHPSGPQFAEGNLDAREATFGFDYSPGDVSRENVQLTAGARFNAPFGRREKDRIACAFVYSKISDPFRQFNQLLGGGAAWLREGI